jgi:putative transposase
MKKLKNNLQLTRTLSNWNSFDHFQTQILRFMSHESKNIYNVSIFHMQIYFNYSNQIFKKLYKLVKNKVITNITDFDSELYKIYDEFYNYYLIIKPFKQHNNKIIYNFIISNIQNLDLVNDNYYIFEKFVIKSIEENKLLKFPINTSIDTKNELFYDIVSSILKNIYTKNFNETKESIIHKKKCRIQNEQFINQVKNNKNLFKENNIVKYKPLLKKNKLFENLPKKKGIKSDKNYIGRIIYRYYTNPLIPSDLMCNIIVKAYQSYSSFFALRKKGIKSNIPKFLDQKGKFILPFFARSRKEIKINNKYYYRLTVGSTVANKFINIIDDNRLVCLDDTKQNKLYTYKKYLLPLKKGTKLTKKDNYFWNNHYIPKKSKNIIQSYYILIRKPTKLNNKKIKLIEIIPIYDGFRFKINFVYDTEKTKNKPIKNKGIAIDLGMKNLMVIYDPEGEQYIIPGNNIIATNYYYNNKINYSKSLLSKNKKTKKTANELIIQELEKQIEYIEDPNCKYIPIRKTINNNNSQRTNAQLDFIESKGKINNIDKRQHTSKRIKKLLIARENKINDYFNKIVKWITKKYANCENIIIGYNEGWKKNVNMGKTMNGKFYQIPYRKLIIKLKNELEKNNQKLIITEESYTSKCDALALEKIGKHENYKGKRIKRGLYSSSTGKLINADLNGAINIMRKWEEKQGIKITKVKGEKIYNPKKINIHKAIASGE